MEPLGRSQGLSSFVTGPRGARTYVTARNEPTAAAASSGYSS